jgi:hypothetical protein
MKTLLLLPFILLGIQPVQPQINPLFTINPHSRTAAMIGLYSIYIGYIAYATPKKEITEKNLFYVANSELKNYFKNRKNTTLVGVESCAQGCLYVVKKKCIDWQKFLIISSIPAIVYGTALVIKP